LRSIKLCCPGNRHGWSVGGCT